MPIVNQECSEKFEIILHLTKHQMIRATNSFADLLEFHFQSKDINVFSLEEQNYSVSDHIWFHGGKRVADDNLPFLELREAEV